MFGLGTTEILLIVAVLFLLFGATKLPQLAKSLGATRKAFKDGMREAEEEEKAEQQQKLSSGAAAVSPQITEMNDEALEAELRRRAEARVEH
jgi:TatA/E family protein of Tat protein translocase